MEVIVKRPELFQQPSQISPEFCQFIKIHCSSVNESHIGFLFSFKPPGRLLSTTQHPQFHEQPDMYQL